MFYKLIAFFDFIKTLVLAKSILDLMVGWYSQTSISRPLFGPLKGDCLGQVVVL